MALGKGDRIATRIPWNMLVCVWCYVVKVQGRSGVRVVHLAL